MSAHRTRRPLLLLLLLAAGCFDPRYADVRCGDDPPGACPDGYQCAPDGVCRRPGETAPRGDGAAGRDARLPDGAPTDARTPDGPPTADAPTADARTPDGPPTADAPIADGAPAADAPPPPPDAPTDGPVVLVTGEVAPFAVATDGTYVYFTNRTPGGSVARVPIVGGAREQLAGPLARPGFLAVAGPSDVYWTDEGSYNGPTYNNDGAVLHYTGGAAVTIATAQRQPAGIVVDAAWVYWANQSGTGIVRAPRAGGAPAPYVAASAPYGLAIDPAGTTLYFAERAGGYVSSSVNGAAATRLTSAASSLVALDGATLLYLDALPPSSVYAIPTVGGAPRVIAAVISAANGLAAAGGNVYWSDQDVWRAPAAGGAPVRVSSTSGQPQGIAVDARYVYWANFGPGEILRAPR